MTIVKQDFFRYTLLVVFLEFKEVSICNFRDMVWIQNVFHPFWSGWCRSNHSCSVGGIVLERFIMMELIVDWICQNLRGVNECKEFFKTIETSTTQDMISSRKKHIPTWCSFHPRNFCQNKIVLKINIENVDYEPVTSLLEYLEHNHDHCSHLEDDDNR